MATQELALVDHGQQTPTLMPAIMESVLMAGDLAKLTSQQRVSFYASVCESVGLNPLTKPFEYIVLNGKMTLYATKNCTDQLRYVHNISVESLHREVIDGILITTAGVSNGKGRKDEDIGAVSIEGLKGEAKANALMKSTTKAKRRATLSICGLSMPDESEIESIQGARRVPVDMTTGELIEQARQIDTGGHPIGTQAAANHVAERKVSEMKSQAGGKGPDYYKMLEAFKAIKPQIGTEAYYRILGTNGYEKSSMIPDVTKGRAIYTEMNACLKAQQSRAADEHANAVEEQKTTPKPAEQVADESDLPSEMWPEGRT